MPRLSKLIEKIEDRLANKWGCWYERNKARVPLYAVLGGIGWYLYGMFLNSLKLGKESVFNTTGEVIESIWVFNPFKNLFAVFTPFGLGVSAFIALMVCLITKKGYSWFSGYKFTRDARGFDILPDGTHGTSGFATKKELAEHLELGSAEEVTGMLLGRIKARPDDPEKYATYVAHRMKPGENNNILCIGAPGSYKSRGFIIPFLMGCAQRSSGGHHESVVVTDPKGELFENLAPYFREHGFYVKAVNFLDMAHSDGWNCLAGLEANPDLVTTVANTIIQNTSGPKEADDFWSRAELNLLMALIHYVCNLKDARGNLLPLEQRSLGDVYKILAYKSVNEINRILAELPPEHPAKGPHGLFLKARENLWGNIIIGLGNRLAVFQNPLVDKITRNHDVDLLLPGQKPCAYFVIISAQDSAYRFLSSLFFSLTFPQLSNYARLHGGRLPVSNQQKYILEILKEFKYLRVRQLHAMVRTHYRAQGIEIDARRMEIMLRQMRTGTNYVWLRGDVVSYGDRRIDPRLLEALDVMLELTKAQPGFYSKDGLHEPFLLRFTGNGKGAGYLFSVAWLDAATHIATVPRMKGERIIWISESNSFGEINLPRHHFFAVRQEDGTHRFFGSNEPGKI